MPTETQHLEQRVAALQSDLNARDQALGEPVYMVRTHGSCCWEEVGSGSLEDFQSMPEEYELRALYTHPDAQLDTGTNSSDKYKGHGLWQRH